LAAMNTQKTKCSKYKGLAIVEMAIVLVLLLMLTLGCIHYGWLFLKAQQITNAARHGARIAVRRYAMLEDGEAAIDLLMSEAGISMAGATRDVNSVSLADGSAGVTASITVPKANVVLMDVFFLPSPNNLGASVTMAQE
jgi:Flp pilus assembly protein TadG